MKGVVVVGAGGHAKVVIDTLRAMGRTVDFCVADHAVEGIDVPVRTGDDQLARLLNDGYRQAIVAVGDNAKRAQLAAKISAAGFELISAISPQAVVSRSVVVGSGVLIQPGAILNAGVRIEDLAIINTAAVIEHDSRVAYGAHLGPASALAGRVSVGKLTLIGLGARVIPGITIGANVIVGAGAVIIADLPDDVTAVGVPARILKRRA
jgi:UDP-perosamine 4-acetyltransferase